MSGICTLWWSSPAGYHDRLTTLLDPVEASRAAGYQSAADRARFTLGVAMTKLGVARQCDVAPGAVRVSRRCPDCAAPHGRPVIAEDWADVSVSHAGDLVVVAVCTGGAIGVDVDRLDPALAGRVATRVLSGSERRRFVGLPEPARAPWVARLWSLKEAVVKATGDGLRVPPARIDIDFDGDTARLLAYPGRPDLPAGLRLVPVAVRPAGYAAAVALPVGVHRLVERDGENLVRALVRGG